MVSSVDPVRPFARRTPITGTERSFITASVSHFRRVRSPGKSDHSVRLGCGVALPRVPVTGIGVLEVGQSENDERRVRRCVERRSRSPPSAVNTAVDLSRSDDLKRIQATAPRNRCGHAKRTIVMRQSVMALTTMPRIVTLNLATLSLPGCHPEAANDPVCRVYGYAVGHPDRVILFDTPTRPELGLGYWIRRGQTGCGFAKPAAAGLIEAALSIREVDSIAIAHDRANTASRRIPEKLGFTLIGDRAPGPRRHGVGVFDRRCAEGEHGVVDRMPVSAELNTTVVVSFSDARCPHDPHTGGGDRSRISIVTVSVSRSRPRTSISGRPTGRHMRGGLDPITHPAQIRRAGNRPTGPS